MSLTNISSPRFLAQLWGLQLEREIAVEAGHEVDTDEEDGGSDDDDDDDENEQAT